jgi:hypothetical protein
VIVRDMDVKGNIVVADVFNFTGTHGLPLEDVYFK